MVRGFRANARDYNFEGIIRLNNCSGSLIRLKQSVETDPALILTNGHCLEGGMPKPGEIITNEKSSREFSVRDPKTAKDMGTVSAVKIVFSSMTNTDMTIYALKETYQTVQQKFKIRPVLLADRYPEIGEPIDVISGYWSRGYTCNVEAIVPALQEGGYLMLESVRYSRPGCEIIGGTSGSPVISKKTGEVIAVNNTINENGESCTMNNPCEIGANGKKTAKLGYGYAQQTNWLYACMSGPTSVDLKLPNCKLAKKNSAAHSVRR